MSAFISFDCDGNNRICNYIELLCLFLGAFEIFRKKDG